ncbi:MAG: hypothetical protein EOO28_10530 [Comamonadaceae bacterium]|nr:MAG: hypothetical protein EOO28_10530 [Comamonadaceae bacterium]
MATQNNRLTPHTDTTPVVVELATELSGSQWVDRFNGSSLESDLVDPFRTNLGNFIAAMRAAGMKVKINATYRPDKRAFLMHFSGKVANGAIAPKDVPTYAAHKVTTRIAPQDMDEYAINFDIEWQHSDLAKSLSAAADMQKGYKAVFPPAYPSKHTARQAVDMWITWTATAVEKPIPHFEITVKNADLEDVIISTNIKNVDHDTAASNAVLHAVGLGFGIRKLLSDKPHWSDDGK